MAEPKDLILGILGASGTLAGLLLVFSGYLFAQAASFPAANTDDATIEKYTKVGRFAVWPFLGFVVATVLCVAWLIHAQECVYWICASIFLISVVATGIYGAVASYRYL